MKIGQMAYKKYDPLYRRGSKDRVLYWRAEVLGHKYRSLAGIMGKTLNWSAWVEAQPMNVGKANATTPHQQACAEVEAKMRGMRKKKGYVDHPSDVDTEMSFLVPMTAHTYEKGMELPPSFAVQPKLNGYRSQNEEMRSTFRSGDTIQTIPHIRKALEAAFKKFGPDLVIDGELYNHTHRELLNQTSSALRKQNPSEKELEASADLVELHVYDCYYKQKLGMSQRERLQLMEQVVRCIHHPKVKMVPCDICTTQAQLDAIYRHHLQEGYEGSIIRFLDAPYEHKRSHSVLKYKPRYDAEFEAMHFESGRGKRANTAAKLVCRVPRGKFKGVEFTANIKGKDAEKAAMWDRRDEVAGKPVTISFAYITEFGKPFHNYLEKIWWDGVKI
jgi:ATP-dependent DNA ligase